MSALSFFNNYGVTESTQANAEKLENEMFIRCRKANSARLRLFEVRRFFNVYACSESALFMADVCVHNERFMKF